MTEHKVKPRAFTWEFYTVHPDGGYHHYLFSLGSLDSIHECLSIDWSKVRKMELSAIVANDPMDYKDYKAYVNVVDGELMLEDYLYGSSGYNPIKYPVPERYKEELKKHSDMLMLLIYF